MSKRNAIHFNSKTRYIINVWCHYNALRFFGKGVYKIEQVVISDFFHCRGAEKIN